ncbi:MAG TPA: hypothetical protein PLL33_01410 [Paracoccus sp. (in: a-proteobacteria)]|nr:hypothetical protein [Paracoccus sp. (in: a-proteobacteria)]
MAGLPSDTIIPESANSGSPRFSAHEEEGGDQDVRHLLALWVSPCRATARPRQIMAKE